MATYDSCSGFSRRREKGEMHDAGCDKCKKECQVPFKPSGDRPVFCKGCYANQ